ncbi:hypothetical protein BX667DRAFT_485138 [Coemansia mojavensis]|nr:hypothetical protein BX667DRAFT_474948 [Coemansia mojavensis]KAI9479746.1 hypothetical protein BX667DRAFT_485138 [Coemansia mojavensis]
MAEVSISVDTIESVLSTGSKVKVLDIDKHWYTAIVLAISKGKVMVHYPGWDHSFNEWIPVDSRRLLESSHLDAEDPELAGFDLADAINKAFPPELETDRKGKVLRTVDPGPSVKLDDSWVDANPRGRFKGSRNRRRVGHIKSRPRKSAAKKADPGKQTTPIDNSEPAEECEAPPIPAELRIPEIRLAANSDNPYARQHCIMQEHHGYYPGQLVEVLNSNRKWYMGRVITYANKKFLVHYNGWNHSQNEWIAAGSKRLSAVRESTETEEEARKICVVLVDEYNAYIDEMEKKKAERAAAKRKPKPVSKPSASMPVAKPANNETINSTDPVNSGEDEPAYMVEDETDEDVEPISDSATWFVYCNLCNVVIRTFRYYCVSCEKPSDGYDYESYDLCLMCFSKSFPSDHPHPPTCFARSAVGDIDGVVQFTSNVLSKYRKQSLAANSDSSVDMFADVVAVYEPDEFDTSYNMPSATGNTWSKCAFCGEEAVYERDILGGFAGDHPFILASTTEDGTSLRRRFWAHDACARYSPEVLVSDSGKWFNVAAALRRGRTIKCAICKRRGATVGCFHGRCQKSYHVMCTQKPKEFFEQGFTYWCPRHSRIASGGSRLGRDALDEEQHTARCANCNHELSGDLMWMTCLECPNEPKRQFNICLSCYDSKDALVNHPHKKRCFREHLSHAGGVSSTGKYLVGRAGPGRKPKNPAGCHYCRSRQSRRWRKGYGGVVMCETCFNTAHSLQGGTQQQQQQPMQTSALVEDYAQSIYFTRETCIASNRIGMTSVSQQPLGQLSSYGPTDSMLFTLAVDSSYFDIPGRAPRWGSHSGTDYHGTWLPQTVRRALLRYTKRGDRVLSNFLGRGTDAIECFLLSRKCIGVDINPSAVALAQRNCSFTIMPDSGMSVEFRPAIMQGDARQLTSGLWPGATYFAEPESFDHILSHPPYKDCVLYSTNIEGDLSRFPGPEEFQREMEKVVSESWRLLRMGRHLTLGIGDNRAECFYIPVSYQLFRTYINYGFELEELIVKRQRYCQAFGLGTYLCVQFDFLMFTHEFIATLRKVPQNQVDRMHLTSEQYTEHKELGFHGHHTADSISAAGSMLNRLVSIKCRTLREVPPSPIARKSVVMGSVWTFEPHPVFLFSHLCMSRMVQRFGRDESNWEQIDLVLENKKVADAHVQLKTANAESGNHDDMSDSEPEFADNGTRAGGYELERQRQIQENREQLLHLGLVSELGEDSTDTAHYQKMVAMCPRLPLDATPLALIVVPHISNLEFKRCHVEPYRQALVQITHDASNRLCPSGLLVIGVQDVRDENGKLWPLGMLVLEDVQRAIGNIRLRLKEFIVVVENGHARKRDDVVSRETFVDEKCIVGVSNIPHVPIVHAYYLVFMKLK